MGCGAGLYVAKWRNCGLSFAGYDANPHTTELSCMLLPDNDTPCGVADLTEELDVENQFDIVVCKDVLPYIPTELEQIAIRNLTKLSGRFIILSWEVQEEISELPHRQVSEETLLSLMKNEKFVKEKYMTNDLRVLLNRKNCCVLTKQE
ncbi:MAG: class I SAM-dependent methyltransferase [Bacteroidaceae bacterium]|nr:class I SAM-dependent methyltransferase [Bacteroidaceae bacterium]